MQRTDRPHLNRRQTGQSFLHHRAVFPDDIRIVPTHLLLVHRKVDLIVVVASVECPEHTERIAREEHSVGRIIGNHRFGPMHPRGENKFQLVVSQIERIAILHFDEIVAASEVGAQHLEGLGVSDNLHIRELTDQLTDFARVIQLHVVYDQIIELATVQHLLDPIHIKAVGTRFDRIHQRTLLIANQI